MITRLILSELERRLKVAPAVVLLGPRQIGKTTLALEIANSRDTIYLDLESPADRSRLSDPELYLGDHLDRLVVLDEIHRVPDLFPVLRGLIDLGRRQGRRHGLYLLLGSASLDLMRQSGETLAGRISFLELPPFTIAEVPANDSDRLWVRGGFPESFLAEGEAASQQWRIDFIRSYLERDIPQFGPRLPAETLRRFWTMLAHHQGGLLNVAQLARNLGVDVRTVSGYIDLLVDLFLVRRLPAWHANVGKRLVRSPKVYVRDTGLLHSLLAIGDKDSLLGHPVVGASWEGFVIQNLLTLAPEGVTGYFYRSSGGAEIDLLLAWPGERLWAIEVKRSLSPAVDRGFHSACEDLEPERRYVVYPGIERYPVAKGVNAISLRELAEILVAAGHRESGG